VLGGIALWGSAPALALIHRGHTFSFAIEGEQGQKLSKPSGVAVNESTGDVYVVDAGNSRVERFSATGSFIAAWGWGVTDGKEEYEVCTSACKAGLTGTGPAQFNSPEAIAIDNSTGPSGGDVYVVSDTVSVPNVIEKFSSTGVSLGRMKTEGIFGIGGVGVDASGTVWIWELEEGRIDSFTDALENAFSTRIPIEESAAEACGSPGFAVDAGGEAFYVDHRLENAEQECPEGAPSTKSPAVAAQLHSVGEPPVAAVLIQGLDTENTTAIAVDPSTGAQASGDVYVDNVTGIAAFTSAGALIQRFGAEAELTKGRGVAVDAQRGEVLVADAGKNRIDVFGQAPAGAPMVDSLSSQNLAPGSTRLEAQIDANGIDTHYYFQYGTVDCKVNPSSCTDVPLPPPGAGIGSGFGDVAVSATLTGLQSGTTYFYRVIAENEKGEQAEGAQTANTFTTLPNPVGLLPDGREWELVSPPEKGGSAIEAIGGSGAPQGGIMEASEDGNAITYVADGPVEPEPEGSRSPEGTQVLSKRSTAAWNSKDLVTPNKHGEGYPSALPQAYQFFSSDLASALLQPWGLTNMQEPPLVPGVEQEERGIYRRSNFTCEATPATCYQPIITNENDTAEVKENFGGEAVGYKSGINGTVSATADLSHVVFSSTVALTGPKQKPSELGVPRLYEWSAASAPSEQLEPVSVLPSGKLASRPALGNFVPVGTAARNAISEDGSRVFWSGGEEGAEELTTNLYVRDTSRGETLKINVPAAGAKVSGLEAAHEEAQFQIASSDGSRVFFTDTAPLTPDSTLAARENSPADLYECDLVEVAEKLTCNLTDLTVDPRAAFGETAEVIGIALGASEDGSSIYFVANGVLSDDAASHGAKLGDCLRPNSGVELETPKAECNLYYEHYNSGTKTWEAPRFIAILSEEDNPDWNGGGSGPLAGSTARVSSSGRYLAFMSNRSLTGYDNVDANPEAKGARDEEVFLYDSETQRLVCASCNPSGAPPHGVLDTRDSGEGLGLVVDRPTVWRSSEVPKWLAGSIPGWTPLEPNTAPYQSRYLNDEGRLFFNGADALVSQDTNGKEDVYQYEPEGLGSCTDSRGCVALISSGTAKNESAFLDASASGNDVFFVTAAQLVATDHDNGYDVYDARVCTESSPCIKPPPPPPKPCEDEEHCRPPAPAPSVFEAPPSSTFSGPGNIARQETLAAPPTSKPKPLTKAQKLAKALTACRKKYKHAKKKRAACEKQARKNYGSKAAAKHKAGKKK
jgi:DNA-binding beta-propeller fold protein YncE